MNVNILLTVVVTIILFFAAPIVFPFSPVLAVLMWIFAGWYAISSIILILAQWFVSSIQEDPR
jgi:hypothetical protein